jgi:sulfoacetaldehyde dehydrogenase
MQMNVTELVAALIARARAAQAAVDGYTQQQADDLALACGWAIMEPARNRALAELAVRDTDWAASTTRSPRTIARTARFAARPAHRANRGCDQRGRRTRNRRGSRGRVGVVAAITPSTNPGATPPTRSSMR